MPQQGLIFRILVASPSDCVQERKAIPDVIYAWNAAHSYHRGLILEPVLWETHSRPELGDRPQGILNRQLVEGCDILIGAFWTRLGTHTGQAESGTAEEIEEFRRAGKPVLLYFSSVPVVPESIDPTQYTGLTEYRKKLEAEGIVSRYESIADLREQLHRHLSSLDLLRGTNSEAVELHPDQQQLALTAFKQEFESFRRRLEAAWQAERDSEPHSTDDAKYIFEHALGELLDFMARIGREESPRLSELMGKAARTMKEIQRHQSYIDGGKSFREFWELGDQCLQTLAEVRSELDSMEDQLAKSTQSGLTDEQVEMIKVLAKDGIGPLTAEEIATKLSLSVQKTQFFLDGMLDGSFIFDRLVIGSPRRYQLARGGREELVRRGLL